MFCILRLCCFFFSLNKNKNKYVSWMISPHLGTRTMYIMGADDHSGPGALKPQVIIII